MNIKLSEPIAILGFGTEGQYALEFCRLQGKTDITIFDENPSNPLPKDIKTVQGPDALEKLMGYKTAIKSPGIPLSHPGIVAAKKEKVKITSLMELTLKVAAERITAITGTNGKTTTTALCELILRAHYGDQLIVGGNDRTPILKEVIENPESPILMEASSFQFAELKDSAHVGAILNITPNHLDWHMDFDDYVRAKSNILRHQSNDDWALLNAGNLHSSKLTYSTIGRHFWINDKRDKHWAVWERGYLQVSFNDIVENVLHYDQLNCKTHPDNILFAVAIAKIHGVPLSTIEEQIKAFKGVEHRLEHTRTLKDVHFYNDSSSTSPESAMAAIEQFIPRKLILLLGGSSKKADFTPLAQKITDEKVRVYLYGDEKDSIEKAIIEAGGKDLILKKDPSTKLASIVQSAYELAKPEDNVVLSPACASFDLFANAKERGKQFKEVVEKLK